MINWKPMADAPKDRPIGVICCYPKTRPMFTGSGELSEKLDPKGGWHISLTVCQWEEERNMFVIGYGQSTSVGLGCGHAWCEVEELSLQSVMLDALAEWRAVHAEKATA